MIRPAIATPIPNPRRAVADRAARLRGQRRVHAGDAGAVRPDGGGLRPAKRYGVDRPRVALLSIGEEKSKGTPLEKEAHALLADGSGRPAFDFVGNVEGRDFFDGTPTSS